MYKKRESREDIPGLPSLFILFSNIYYTNRRSERNNSKE
nr:MAG TPA: hypothetical protein [Bacteriophage sp.]